MVHSITVCIAAVVIFFTSIQAAPVQDSLTVQQLIARIRKVKFEASRLGDIQDFQVFEGLAIHADPKRFIHEAIDGIRKFPLRSCPTMMEEVLKEPDADSMPREQMQLARSYHAYVFNRLNSFFPKLRDYINNHNHNKREGALREGLRYCGNLAKEHDRLTTLYDELGWKGPHLDLLVPAEPIGVGEVDVNSCMETIAKFRGYMKKKMSKLLGRCHARYMAQICPPLLESNHQVESLVTIADWPSPCRFSELNQLPLTDLRILQLRLEHERLIVDRAQYNQAILLRCLPYHPLKPALVSKRLSEYSRFIEQHKETIRSYEQVLQHGQHVDASICERLDVNPVPVSFTSTARTGNTHLPDGPSTKVVDAPYTTPVLLRHPVVGPSVPPRVEDVQYDGLQYGNPAA
ncbi:hypothetical protein SeLEV6574_g08593, partial [Synchytrium endobioticum]